MYVYAVPDLHPGDATYFATLKLARQHARRFLLAELEEREPGESGPAGEIAIYKETIKGQRPTRFVLIDCLNGVGWRSKIEIIEKWAIQNGTIKRIE